MAGKQVKLSGGCGQRAACLLLLVCIGLVLPSAVSAAEAPPIGMGLMSPRPGTVALGKRPELHCVIQGAYEPGAILVLLDGVDITGMAVITPEGFVATPAEILPAGAHVLQVIVATSDGTQYQQEFRFSTRHFQAVAEAYTQGEVSAVYENALYKSERLTDQPYNKVEANWGNAAMVREGGWEVSLTSNLRYKDQSLPVADPERNGVDLANYLLRASYTGREMLFNTEIGDVQIDQSSNTITTLGRRGGKLDLKWKGVTLEAYSVATEQLWGFQGGTGMDTDDDEHIMGASLRVDMIDDQVGVKVVYASGGDSGSGLGTWTEDLNRRSQVWGVVMTTNFFQEKLVSEVEVDWSDVEADRDDGQESRGDNAWRVGLSGAWDWASYHASYEYVGPDYELVGNQSLQNDRQGFSLGGGASMPSHMVNVSFGQYQYNVEDDPTVADVDTSDATVDYTYSGWAVLPVNLGYQYSLTKSGDEPEGALPVDTDVNTFSASATFMQNAWNVGLQGYFSMLDDKIDSNNDSNTFTVTLAPTYGSQFISVTPSLTWNQADYTTLGLVTDTYTVNLDVRGYLGLGALSYELTGTYNNIKANDDSSDMETLNTLAGVSWRLADNLWGYVNPSIGLRGQYIWTNDHAAGTDEEEIIVTLVLSCGLPYTF